jgi:hypothetical protein
MLPFKKLQMPLMPSCFLCYGLTLKLLYLIAVSLEKALFTLNQKLEDVFYVGQTVTIAGCGSSFNGSKVITAVGEDSITMATNHGAIKPKHPVQPFGSVTATNYTDWTTDAAVQNAALMVATEIWQARTATLSGSNLVDYQPSPYRMSAQLLAKVRGLIAHALSPSSMVG